MTSIFSFDNTLDASAIAALLEEIIGKNRIDAEKKLKSKLHLCIGDKAQRIFKASKPAVSIKTQIGRNSKRIQTRTKRGT